MSVVGAIKDLWLIQNVVGFVSIIKWHITFCGLASVILPCRYFIQNRFDTFKKYCYDRYNIKAMQSDH